MKALASSTRGHRLRLYESLTFGGNQCHCGDTPSSSLQIPEGVSPFATRRLTAGQFNNGLCGCGCVNVGIVYVHPLSVKSNSPEGPLRRVPFRHTVYFLCRDPYYAVAERCRSFLPTVPIDPALQRSGR
jgi:hypothetical protein